MVLVLKGRTIGVSASLSMAGGSAPTGSALV